MEQPGRGIVGREGELARVQSFIGSVSEGPSALLLEGAAGIGKTTLWHAGVSIARTRGLRVLSCRAAVSEARLSYAALGDLFDFELPDLPAPQRRAMDAALLRAEVEGAPPDQRAVSVASLGVGSGGDPLGLGQTGPVPLRRVPIGPLPEEAMTRLLRDRSDGV
jgi:AAA ATPase domain